VPPPIPDNIRTAILADVRAHRGSCRSIGRTHGVSDATVRKLAKDAGLVDAFSRAQTENATRARVADIKAQRAQLAVDLLSDVHRLRHRAWSPYVMPVSGPEGVELVELKLPPLGEVRNAYTSIGIAVDKHLALIRVDADAGTEEARSMIGALAAGLQVAYEQMQGAPDASGD
jgi:hypothetical protein